MSTRPIQTATIIIVRMVSIMVPPSVFMRPKRLVSHVCVTDVSRHSRRRDIHASFRLIRIPLREIVVEQGLIPSPIIGSKTIDVLCLSFTQPNP